MTFGCSIETTYGSWFTADDVARAERSGKQQFQQAVALQPDNDRATDGLRQVGQAELAQAIYPTGYHNQKARSLRGAGKLPARLALHREAAYLAQSLTRICCDAPLAAGRDDLRRRTPDLPALGTFCTQQGFGSMLVRQAERIAVNVRPS